MKNNKKVTVLLVLIISFIIFAGCSRSGVERKSFTHNPTGEEILYQNKDADIFVFNDLVYVNADNIEWVKALELKTGEKVGAITKSYKKGSKFENGTATKLPINTEIYKATGDRSNEVLLVKLGNRIIRSLALVEG